LQHGAGQLLGFIQCTAIAQDAGQIAACHFQRAAQIRVGLQSLLVDGQCVSEHGAIFLFCRLRPAGLVVNACGGQIHAQARADRCIGPGFACLGECLGRIVELAEIGMHRRALL
jgi:hypothetical protein